MYCVYRDVNHSMKTAQYQNHFKKKLVRDFVLWRLVNGYYLNHLLKRFFDLF